MLRTHEIFQGYYYYHHVGGNRDEREKFKSHEHYEDLIRWCALYDQKSFDPEYPNLPLAFFIPLVEKVLLERPAFWWDKDHPARATVTGNKMNEGGLQEIVL